MNRWAIASLLILPFLGACGGAGESAASVSTVTAVTVRYTRTMTVTAIGRGMGTDMSMTADDDGCISVAKVSGSNEDTQQFTCTVNKLGDLVIRVRTGEDGRILGTLRLEVPKPQVTMATTQGTMVFELDPEAAPVTVKNFLTYVGGGFYGSTTIFHRLIKDVIAQAGGYKTGRVALTGQLAPIVLESNNGLKNLRGTIAMARTDVPNSATSEFYLNLADNPSLDYVNAETPGYAVFGKLVAGDAALTAINNVPSTNFSTQFPNLPSTEISITAIQQTK